MVAIGFLFIFFLVIPVCARSPCPVTWTMHSGTADCAGRRLSSIPDNLPPNITVLDLSHNSISLLPTHAFKKFENLTFLDLNNNRISRVDETAFAGLTKLVTLNIGGNKLTANRSSLPCGIFNDLHDLQTLVIENNKFDDYPDWVLSSLSNLQNLYIDSDAAYPEFGPGFRHLKSLRVLQIDSRLMSGGRCSIRELTNKTFKNLQPTPVEKLVINYCEGLLSCEQDAFKPLELLTSLEFSNNHIGVQTAMKILGAFVGRNMTSIHMNNINVRGTPDPTILIDRILVGKSLQNLRNLCVSQFSMSQNNILWLDDIVTDSIFSKCVTKLDFSKNYLKGNIKFIFLFHNFKNLIDLRIGFQNEMNVGSQMMGSTFTIRLPPNLMYLDVTGQMKSNYWTCIRFLNAKQLKTVMIGYSKMNNLIEFIGVDNVTTVDMSGQTFPNYQSVLNSFPRVEELTLRFCNFQFNFTSNKKVFQALGNIVKLDISHNDMQSLPPLTNPFKVSFLNLSHNQLDHVFALDEYKNLTILDLSNNLIGQIGKEARLSLDEGRHNPQLKIRVQGNPFVCGCDNLDFIVWIVYTSVIYESNRNFTCIQDDGSTAGAVDIAHKYYIRNQQCNGRLNLAVAVSLFAILTTSLAITYVISRNTTRFYNTLMKLFGIRVDYLGYLDFTYTIYIGYCDKDIPFVYQTLKPALENQNCRLFLKDRDVLPGVPIADGIIAGIENSWKTLLVLSWDFLEDPWSEFTVSTAVHAMTDLVPNRIIVLLVDDLQKEHLPEVLLNALEEDSMLHLQDFRMEDLWQEVHKLGNF